MQNLLPKKLPKAVEAALEKKTLTPSSRNKIVRAIADKCFEEGTTGKMVNAVADLATERWSPLKTRFGKPSATLATQIKRRISKLRLHSKRVVDTEVVHTDIEEEDVHCFNQKQMVEEMQKKCPSVLKLKRFLDATRDVRQEKVNNSPALEILFEYPALKISDLLLWEFTKITNVEEGEMIARWKNFLDRIKKYLMETQNVTSLSESYEALTIEVLMKLPSLVPSGKRTNEVTKFVLQVYEENTVLDEVLPPRSDPPRLIAIGKANGAMLFAFVDGAPIFSESCPIRSVLLLLATYWVFNIQFVPEARPSLHLISAAVLKDRINGKLKSNAAVDCLLKQLNL